MTRNIILQSFRAVLLTISAMDSQTVYAIPFQVHEGQAFADAEIDDGSNVGSSGRDMDMPTTPLDPNFRAVVDLMEGPPSLLMAHAVAESELDTTDPDVLHIATLARAETSPPGGAFGDDARASAQVRKQLVDFQMPTNSLLLNYDLLLPDHEFSNFVRVEHLGPGGAGLILDSDTTETGALNISGLAGDQIVIRIDLDVAATTSPGIFNQPLDVASADLQFIIPEPASLTLLCLGASGALAMRSRPRYGFFDLQRSGEVTGPRTL